MHEIIEIIKEFLGSIWYTEIFIMMTLESSFFPFPSEVAMIPAGYLWSTWSLNFWFALLVWTTWALTWASINYFLGYYLWWKTIKKLIKNYWKYFLIKEEHYEKSENYFKKHWVITTFLARFITVVRQLISIPAWVFKMNFTKFFIYTGLWAWAWNLILMIIWYVAAENQELVEQYTKELLIFSFIFVILIGYLYYYKNKKNEDRKNKTS